MPEPELELPDAELLLTDEVAAIFRVSPVTIQNWSRDPDNPLKGFRVGRNWLFPRWQIRLLIARDQAKADR